MVLLGRGSVLDSNDTLLLSTRPIGLELSVPNSEDSGPPFQLNSCWRWSGPSDLSTPVGVVPVCEDVLIQGYD